MLGSMGPAADRSASASSGGAVGIIGWRAARVGPGWLLLAWAAAAGCLPSARLRTADRYERGLVVILPGVEGVSLWTRDLIEGLDDGGVGSAIEVCDWTVGVPGSMLINLSDLDRNRRQAQRIADMLVRYRDKHPGRPVHLIGYSGGGGVGILALEAMPPGRQIDAALLIAPAMSPSYDLTTALRRTARMFHLYSPRDVPILKLGTSLFGAIDREFGPSAGAVGFRVPEDLDEEGRRLYGERLRQVEWSPALRQKGASGSHLGWLNRRFAREYLAPIIVECELDRAMRGGRVSPAW